MTATGGLLILGIGLQLLEIKRIRVANLLPALALAPLGVAVLGTGCSTPASPGNGQRKDAKRTKKPSLRREIRLPSLAALLLRPLGAFVLIVTPFDSYCFRWTLEDGGSSVPAGGAGHDVSPSARPRRPSGSSRPRRSCPRSRREPGGPK